MKCAKNRVFPSNLSFAGKKRSHGGLKRDFFLTFMDDFMNALLVIRNISFVCLKYIF